MNIKTILMVSVMALSLCACGEQKAPSPDISSFSDSEKGDIIWALNTLKSECQSLFGKYADDVEKIEADITEFDHGWCQSDYRCSQYDWKRQIWLQIKLKDFLSEIPTNYRAQGHTLHYILSKDGVSGISSQKPQSQLVCGWQPTEDGSDAFVKF